MCLDTCAQNPINIWLLQYMKPLEYGSRIIPVSYDVMRNIVQG
jgi:hypothetical protein